MTGLIESGSRTRPALPRCIGVPVDEFAASYWGVQPLLTSATGTGGFDDLFSSDAVDELLTVRGLRTPFIRMAKEGTVLPPARYTASGGFGAEVSDQASSEKVLAEFAAGSTIVLQGLHRIWPPLQTFTRDLVAELGHRAQVNAYITPASSRGFDPHYDVHDVFVLQIAGEKRWTIHAPVHTDPLADEPWSQHATAVAEAATHEPVIDTVLSPGDALYLPRGWLHSATALGGTTVHLTIGMPAYTRSDLARRLVERALRSDALRGALPLGIDVADPDRIADEVRSSVAALIDELRGADGPESVRALAADLGSRFAGATRPEPVRPLATVELAADLDPATAVRWRAGLQASIDADADGCRIRLGSRTVTLPATCADAVRALHAGDTLPAGALPGLDAADSLVVARRLLREAVLVPAASTGSVGSAVSAGSAPE